MGTFGDTDVETQTFAVWGVVHGAKFTTSESGTISKISLYCVNDEGNVSHIVVALYSDVAGVATALLAYSSPVTITSTPSWVDFPLSYPITAGAAYWLCFLADDNFLFYRADGGANQDFYKAAVYPTFPNPALADGYENHKISIYATYSTTPKGTIAIHAKLVGVI